MRSFGTLLLTATLTFSGSVSAHQSKSGQDYTKFKQPNGQSCCNGHDCRPVDYSYRNGELVMYPDNMPVIVPSDRLINRSSDDGQAHWCGVRLDGKTTITFCAILPYEGVSLRRVETETRVAERTK